MRQELTGAGSIAPGMNLAGPLQAAAPKNDAELTQLIATKTSAGERALAEPFLHRVADQSKQLAQSGQLRAPNGG
jgi:hypothetical protein